MTTAQICAKMRENPTVAITALEETGILRDLARLPQETVAAAIAAAPERAREVILTGCALIRERAAIAELSKMGPTQLQRTLAGFRPSERQALLEVLGRHA